MMEKRRMNDGEKKDEWMEKRRMNGWRKEG